MDKEQQYFADMEALFKSQQSSTSAQNIKLSAQNEELLKENERMTNRLAQLQATQRSMRSTSRIDDQAEVDDGRKERESADVEEQSDLEVPHDDQPESALRSPVRTLADEAAQAELKSLGEELSNLRKSHSSLTDTMHQLQAELRQVKEANVVLQDQNETYMDILQEKTFSGALLAESAVLNRSYIGSGGRGSISNEGSSVGEDEDLAERDDPDSSFGGADEAAAPDADEDDVPDRPASPVTPRALVHPSVKGRSRSRRDTVRSRRSDANFLQPPTDLASELERSEDAEEDAKGGNGMSAAAREERRRNRRRERSGTVSDDVGGKFGSLKIWAFGFPGTAG